MNGFYRPTLDPEVKKPKDMANKKSADTEKTDPAAANDGPATTPKPAAKKPRSLSTEELEDRRDIAKTRFSI